MSDKIKIENTTNEDVDFIFSLFDRSIIYQREKGYPVWDNYDKNSILRDITEKKQFKVVVDSKIAMVFSVLLQ